MSDREIVKPDANPAPTKNEYESTGVMPKSVMEAITLAKTFHQSGLYTQLKSPAQAVPIILAGMEWGIPPFSAMQNIHLIQGRPVIAATALGMMAKRAGYRYKVSRLDEKGCAIEFYDANGASIGESTYTEEDAKRAGLIGKDNWKNHPRNMYFARAMSNGVRWFCPDATFGAPVYTEDEVPDLPPAPTADVAPDSPEALKNALSNGLKPKRHDAIDAEAVELPVDEDPPYVPDEHSEEQEALL